MSEWYESKATIIEGAARILYVLWWANQCSCGRDYETCSLGGDGDDDWPTDVEHVSNDPGMGAELTEIAPDTPSDAVEWANRLILAVECHSKRDIRDSYLEAAKGRDGHSREPTPARFGNCIAFTACGTGVSWTDDHPASGAQVPDLSYNGPDGDAHIDTRFWNEV